MRASIVGLIAAVLAAASSLPADAARRDHRQHRKAARAPAQIACTVIGCIPVPPGCGQRPGRTWSGLPTGNDVIVCPRGVAPIR